MKESKQHHRDRCQKQNSQLHGTDRNPLTSSFALLHIETGKELLKQFAQSSYRLLLFIGNGNLHSSKRCLPYVTSRVILRIGQQEGEGSNFLRNSNVHRSKAFVTDTNSLSRLYLDSVRPVIPSDIHYTPIIRIQIDPLVSTA